MRSRYTAYTQANINYIEKTMKGPAAQGFDSKEAELWAKKLTWQGLEVLNAKQLGNEGWVEFIARYSHAGKKHAIHEISQFICENGKWFYVDGKTLTDDLNKKPALTEKVGRNKLCPCNSGKKFKKCCGISK